MAYCINATELQYCGYKYNYEYKYFTHKYQYKYKYFTHKYQYKYKYLSCKYQKFVLKMYSSTSTSTKYHIYGKDATEIATDWNFQVSQCSEEKHLRWDAKSYDIYAQNFVGNLRNNLEKWSIFAKAVIRKLSVLLR